MLVIYLTGEEKQRGQLSEENVRLAFDAINRDGFVVLADVLDVTHLDVLHHKMLEDVEAIRARQDAPYNWNPGNVQQDPPPFPPYLFQDILLNDYVIAISQAVLGPKPHNCFYSGNTALPSEKRQPVHRDVGNQFTEDGKPMPCFALVVNVPVVDMTPQNGSTEIWPGTHVIAEQDRDWPNLEVPLALLEQRRKEVLPFQPEVRRGSVLIRDIRLWHAGMPNLTSVPRPMIAMIHVASWFQKGIFGTIKFPKGTENFFDYAELVTDAQFVEEPIDYLHHNAAFAYTSSK